LPKLENGTTYILDRGSLCQILNLVDTFQKCKNNQVINLLLFNFCNNSLFIEVSNNEKFDFLTSNLFSLIVVNGGSITNTQVYQGFHDDKKVEEH